MEILILVLVAVAVPLIVVGAKRGAEAAQRDREQRWGGFHGGLPEPYSWPGAQAGTGMRAPGAEGRVGAPTLPGRSTPAAPETATAAPAPSSDVPRRPGLRGLLRPREEQASPPAAVQRPGRPAPPPRRASTQRGKAAAGPPRPTAESAVASSRPAGTAPLPPRPPIDINRAPVPELQSLPGVGVRAAERIVAHRERNGDFVSVSDLVEVEGFDEHRVSRLAPRATV